MSPTLEVFKQSLDVALGAMVWLPRWFSHRLHDPRVFSNLIYSVSGSQGLLCVEEVKLFFLMLKTSEERNN